MLLVYTRITFMIGVTLMTLLHNITVRLGLFFLFTGLLIPVPGSAETIAIIGTGNVAGALGPEFAALGHNIIYGSRDPSSDSVKALVKRTGNNATATTQAGSVIDADIVVLAVPGGLVESITLSLGDLSGKIIIDPTNPIGSDEDGFAKMAVETSNGEIIQAAAPDAYVVKAFNTLNWQTMIEPDSSGGPVSIPLVGNDVNAKATVAKLVKGMGLESIDLGPIRYARHVEGMLILWISARRGNGTAFDYHLRKVE
jgi:predicted dinucleotide-binding enzyme